MTPADEAEFEALTRIVDQHYRAYERLVAPYNRRMQELLRKYPPPALVMRVRTRQGDGVLVVRVPDPEP